ncbi:hypothetical protein HDU85_006561 [Gaertneriomyces sp. JEL0708]|nr:hypothetical protein HDU85_006561 [Gaertneriomyces sp. JEL0708]
MVDDDVFPRSIEGLLSPNPGANGLTLHGPLAVPSNYQRKYCWGEKMVESLITDIHDSMMRHPDDVYYMGNLVLARAVKSENPTVSYHVVDGQQRFTTLLIILAVLCSMIKDNNEKERLNNIIRPPSFDGLEILLVKDGGDKYGREHIIFRETIVDGMDDVLCDRDPGDHLDDDQERAYNTRLLRNSRKAKTTIESLPGIVKEKVIVPENLHSLAGFVTGRVRFLVVKSDSPSRAFRMFLNLNKPGVGLTGLEYLRSYLWGKLQSNVDVESGMLLRRTQAMQRWDNAARTLSSEKFLELIGHLFRRSLAEEGNPEDAIAETFKLEGFEHFRSSLHKWLISMKTEKLEGFCATLEIAQGKAKGIQEAKGKQIEKFNLLGLTTLPLRGILPSVEAGHTMWEGRTVGIKYLLRRLELEQVNLEILDLKGWRGEVTIEHIYPRNPVNAWTTNSGWADPVENSLLLHSLGNLALLDRSLNSTISNSAWRDKRKELVKTDEKQVSFTVTRELDTVKYEDFTPEHCRRRGAELWRRLQKIYGFKAEFGISEAARTDDPSPPEDRGAAKEPELDEEDKQIKEELDTLKQRENKKCGYPLMRQLQEVGLCDTNVQAKGYCKMKCHYMLDESTRCTETPTPLFCDQHRKEYKQLRDKDRRQRLKNQLRKLEEKVEETKIEVRGGSKTPAAPTAASAPLSLNKRKISNSGPSDTKEPKAKKIQKPKKGPSDTKEPKAKKNQKAKE